MINFDQAKSLLLKIKTNKVIKRHIAISSILVLVFCIAIYWVLSSKYVTTDDAYINANVVQIASRVSGQIAELKVTNNQLVHRGDVLFTIDPNPFKVSLNKAQAQLAMAEAKLHNTQLSANRALALVKVNAMAKQDQDNAIANLQTASAEVALAKAAVDQSQLELQYTKVIAVNDGWIANMNLRVGNLVTVNQPLFALIDSSQYWVDANFKETEMAKIHSGQKATIIVDMYADHKFSGVVESISGGSGAAFSLLPPENATGNWVKVAQRVPVKIRILTDAPGFPLRIGTTASVKVKISD